MTYDLEKSKRAEVRIRLKKKIKGLKAKKRRLVRGEVHDSHDRYANKYSKR
jgi:hypothetical protein